MTNDKDHFFTTGQVSGITWLTQPTLYKYTQEFPDLFSDTARQHHKGRRWSGADLKAIQTIRTLKHSRLGHDNTAAALASGYRDVLSPAADREEFSRLAATIFEQMDTVKRELEETKKELVSVRSFSQRLGHLELHLDALTEHVVKLTRISKWAQVLHLEYRPPKMRY
jgi:DNA-binding transcriptional MerR regulator